MSSADQYFIEENVKKSGTSFFWGMKRLPKEQKRAMFALYVFCREIDDIADDRDEDLRFIMKYEILELIIYGFSFTQPTIMNKESIFIINNPSIHIS